MSPSRRPALREPWHYSSRALATTRGPVVRVERFVSGTSAQRQRRFVYCTAMTLIALTQPASRRSTLSRFCTLLAFVAAAFALAAGQASATTQAPDAPWTVTGPGSTTVSDGSA